MAEGAGGVASTGHFRALWLRMGSRAGARATRPVLRHYFTPCR